MPSCCVPLCCNGYMSEQKERRAAGRPNPSFFKIRPEQVETWNRAVPRADRRLTVKDWVCSDHFHEIDIVRYFEDVTVGDLLIKGEKRSKPILRDGAVPSIFNGPAYLNKPIRKRKAPRDRSGPPEKIANTEEIDQDAPPSPENPTIDQNVDYNNVKLPGSSTMTQWVIQSLPNQVSYIKINEKGTVSHMVKIDPNTKTFTVEVRQCTYPQEGSVETAENIASLLETVDTLKVCEGNGYFGFSKKCLGGIRKGLRCTACRESRKSSRKKDKRRNKLKRRKTQRVKTLHKYKKQNLKLRAEKKSMKKELQESYDKCRKMEKNQVDVAIKDLPKPQQEAVNAMIRAAKRSGPHGNRFTAEWVYECILMRIKGPGNYEHIRKQKILSVPCRTTLNRYMKKLPPVYGFQPALFEILKHKLESMPSAEKHGNFIIDEMKVPIGVSFDKHTKKVIGLVDLGKHTPEKDKNKPGDHVLEILFQPFRGGWVQSLGIFLTNSNCKGDILAKIIVEATILCENAGLFVDGVVTDAAKWNRVMWTEFGIDSTQSSFDHPVREGERFYIFSDWSHIMKCARNYLSPELPKKPDAEKESQKKKKRKRKDAAGNLMTEQQIYDMKVESSLNKQIEVPEGIVKRKHWIALLEEEEKLRRKQGLAALSYVPKLTRDHVFPDGFLRMNVKKAYQFFSNSVAAGMSFYRDEKAVEALEDAEPTIAFIKRMNELADAMNSNGPAGAIRAGNDKERVIREFLEYYKECIDIAKKKGLKSFLSEETDLGILVTLQSTLDLSAYLMTECNYEYVMTARFNSDAIEQFFGQIRNALRQNPHPDPKVVAQMHRLLSIYSLVKPPKGSNVTGGENVKHLLSCESKLLESEKERKEEIDKLIDEVLTEGAVFENMPFHCELDHSYTVSPEECEENLKSFMAGFTAFRQKKIVKNCDDCLLTLTVFREETGADYAFQKTKEIYNGYSYASPELRQLISSIERAIRESVAAHDISGDMFVTTLKYLRMAPEEHVGCLNHKEEVSSRLIKYYLTMRMFFVLENKNIEYKDKKDKARKLAKQSKCM